MIISVLLLSTASINLNIFSPATTNLGKSILAVQLGDSISRGVAIPGFRLEAAPQKVRYIDFELSDKQFEVRYSASFKIIMRSLRIF